MIYCVFHNTTSLSLSLQYDYNWSIMSLSPGSISELEGNREAFLSTLRKRKRGERPVKYITDSEKTQAKQDKLSWKRESARQKRHYTQQALLGSTSTASCDANMSEFDANISIGSVATLSPTTHIVQQRIPHSGLLSPQFQSFYPQLGQKLPELKVNLPTHDLRFNKQLH